MQSSLAVALNDIVLNWDRFAFIGYIILPISAEKDQPYLKKGNENTLRNRIGIFGKNSFPM